MGLASRIVRGYVSRNKLIRNKQVHGNSSHEEITDIEGISVFFKSDKVMKTKD